VSKMIVCDLCDGSGQALTSTCPHCDGLGKIALRAERVLPSALGKPTYFRGALITKRKGANK
jgi:hypothetical protein